MITPEDIAIAKSRIPKTEDELPQPVIKTKLQVGDLNWFKMFFEANDLKNLEIGYYTDYSEHAFSHIGTYGMNLICYSTAGIDYAAECSIMHMNIKYGSVEEAFKLFRNECHNRAAYL